MKTIHLEQGLNFLRSGYLFTSRLRRKAGLAPNSDDPVRLRMLGRRSLLVRGSEGVKFFYDTDRIKRSGAMPMFIRGPLFGLGAVHGLDGEEHTVRKNLLTDLAYDDARVAEFAELVTEELEKQVGRWRTSPGNVYDDLALVYGRAAFRWAGLPLSLREMETQSRRMSRLLDTFGQPSRNPVAWVERARTDRVFTRMIGDVRAGTLTVEEDSVIARVAELPDTSDHTAAVELQNLTRPTVAVSRFAAFAAVALVEHPEWVERIRGESGDKLAVAFAQEVRRTYPFVPMLPALTTQDTAFAGCPVKKGQRVLLDLLGTNTAPSEWENAEAFDPERFLGVDDAEKLTAFIPQGGGEVRSGHRCPGEKITVTALAAAVSTLCRPEVEIAGETEDLTFPWTKMLTRPATGVRVSA